MLKYTINITYTYTFSKIYQIPGYKFLRNETLDILRSPPKDLDSRNSDRNRFSSNYRSLTRPFYLIRFIKSFPLSMCYWQKIKTLKEDTKSMNLHIYFFEF